jgi:hypothetical protein
MVGSANKSDLKGEEGEEEWGEWEGVEREWAEKELSCGNSKRIGHNQELVRVN